MTYVITQGCCLDASCVAVCPVDCIRPTPGDGLADVSMLYVDESRCIDCGACADACPVDAVVPADTLDLGQTGYLDRARDYISAHPYTPHADRPDPTVRSGAMRGRSVAIVGTGPAAWYTAELLVRRDGARVTMIDRLGTTGGLLRYGVAPDHPATRQLGERFDGLRHHPRLRLQLGVEVGRDLSVAELRRRYDAVVYAVGASEGRRLGIPGEDLAGSVTATDVVSWYNGHPEHRTPPAGLDGERAVVVGTGNVALDIARILLGDRDALAGTDIDPAALAALRSAAIREVVVCGRRGPEHLAATVEEVNGLARLAGVDLVVAGDPGVRDALTVAGAAAAALLAAGAAVRPVDLAVAPTAGRRLVLAFGLTPVAVRGEQRVAALGVRRTGQDRAADLDIPASLVVRAIGYSGRRISGLPFDDETGHIAHVGPRVVEADSGAVVAGSYVVGWAGRGARGGIGANRQDALETVTAIRADVATGRELGGKAPGAQPGG